MGWKLKKPIGKDYKKTPDIEKAIYSYIEEKRNKLVPESKGIKINNA